MTFKTILKRITVLRLLKKFGESLTAREIQVALYSVLKDNYSNETSFKQDIHLLLKDMASEEEKLLNKSKGRYPKYSASQHGETFLENAEQDIMNTLGTLFIEPLEKLEMISRYVV